MSSIEFTDGIGAASLSNAFIYPGNRFANWNPSNRPFGERSQNLGTGALNVTAFRDDLTVSLDITGIPNSSQALMLRLEMHLKRGGSVEINPSDPTIPLFGTCKLAPGADVQIQLTDKSTLEYTFSTVLRGTSFLGPTPDGTNEFIIWYDASIPAWPSAALPANGFRMPQWNDKTGRGNHATQVLAIQRPYFDLNIQNGLPGVRFEPDFVFPFLTNPLNFWVRDCLEGFTDGEVFVVLQLFSDPPGGDAAAGFWNFSSAAASYTKYPSVFGPVIEDNFGSDTLRAVPHPGFSLEDAHIYNVRSNTAEWTAIFNEGTPFTDPVNNPGFRNPSVPYPPRLGVSTQSTGLFSSHAHWHEFIFYSPTRTPTQRAAINAYLKAKWGVVY